MLDVAMRRELEICAETLQACVAAAEGGADRIELCAALAVGGVTPSPGFLQEALSAVKLPVHVLIRPRGSGFVYSEAEIRMMCLDVEAAVGGGAAGIVVGMLRPDGTIDRLGMEEMMGRAEGRSVTFHRAFDQTTNLAQSLDTLVELGCSRILTSGGRPTVMEGREELRRLTELAAGRIRVAAGGGITLGNAAQFTEVPGLDLHASLRPKAISMGGDPLWDGLGTDVSADAVRMLSGMVHAGELFG